MAKIPAESGSAKPNKSLAIRELFNQDPKMDSKTVIARLADKGTKVSPTMVYYVRSKMNQAKRKEKRSRVAATTNPVELVLRVKDLARELGGIRHLKQLVDLLAE
jgi:uncharacterized protein YtpQ (UPF0354 family)